MPRLKPNNKMEEEEATSFCISTSPLFYFVPLGTVGAAKQKLRICVAD